MNQHLHTTLDAGPMIAERTAKNSIKLIHSLLRRWLCSGFPFPHFFTGSLSQINHSNNKLKLLISRNNRKYIYIISFHNKIHNSWCREGNWSAIQLSNLTEMHKILYILVSISKVLKFVTNPDKLGSLKISVGDVRPTGKKPYTNNKKLIKEPTLTKTFFHFGIVLQPKCQRREIKKQKKPPMDRNQDRRKTCKSIVLKKY